MCQLTVNICHLSQFDSILTADSIKIKFKGRQAANQGPIPCLHLTIIYVVSKLTWNNNKNGQLWKCDTGKAWSVRVQYTAKVDEPRLQVTTTFPTTITIRLPHLTFTRFPLAGRPTGIWRSPRGPVACGSSPRAPSAPSSWRTRIRASCSPSVRSRRIRVSRSSPSRIRRATLCYAFRTIMGAQPLSVSGLAIDRTHSIWMSRYRTTSSGWKRRSRSVRSRKISPRSISVSRRAKQSRSIWRLRWVFGKYSNTLKCKIFH